MKGQNVKVGDFCFVTDYVANGSFASLKENVTYRSTPDYAILVRITDFTNKWKGNFVWLDVDSFRFLKKSELLPGDLVMANVGEPGKCFIVPDLGQPMTLGPNSILIRPDSTICDTKFLYYYFLSSKGRSEIDKISSATTQSKFNKTSFRELYIPLPPLTVQKQIASILDESEKLIRTDQEMLQKYDDLAQSIFYEMFGDLQINEYNWPIISINKIISFITSGSRGWAKYYSETGNIFLRINNVKENKLFLDDIVFVNPPLTTEAKRTKVQAGDILVSITADLGRTAVIPQNFPTAYINQHLALLRLKVGVNPVYVSQFLSSIAGQKQIKSANKGGVKAGLNFDDIKRLQLLLPPTHLQNEFEHRLNIVRSLIEKQEKAINKSNELFQNILVNYFS
jgi:type I restriction enzyme S subunit